MVHSTLWLRPHASGENEVMARVCGFAPYGRAAFNGLVGIIVLFFAVGPAICSGLAVGLPMYLRHRGKARWALAAAVMSFWFLPFWFLLLPYLLIFGFT
jgi:hypothetical protein